MTGQDPLNMDETDSWSMESQSQLDDDGDMSFLLQRPQTPALESSDSKGDGSSLVFFKIFGNNMSGHLLHKDLQIANADALVQIYDVVPGTRTESRRQNSISQANGKIAVMSLLLD